MKKIILFLLFSNFIFSQEIPSENYFWEYNYNTENGVEALIGVKNCYIRQDATSNSQLLDSLQIGNKIKIVKNTNENLNIKGLNLSWVEIEYYKNNQIKTGFLWKGFIAINFAISDNLTFITTVDRKFSKKIKQGDYEYDADFYGLTIKVINAKNDILTEKSFTKQFSESYFSYSSVIDNWGLKNLIKIYRLGVGGGACGVPTEYVYYGWTGAEFVTLPEKYDVGDAGAYYHTEEFIFPKEKGGQPDIIIKNITEAENTDDNSENYSFLVSKSVEYYSWDGKNFKLIKTKKLKPYIEKED